MTTANTTTAGQAINSLIPVSDEDYKKAIAFLQECCPSFSRYQWEAEQKKEALVQFVVDNLSAANMFIESRIGIHRPLHCISNEDLRKVQEINKSVMARARE